MTNFLFKDFEPVSSKQWKQQIQFDLKGQDYNEKMVHQTPEGIDIKPFYHSDDPINKIPLTDYPESWLIAQKIEVHDAISGNDKAIDALKKGAETLCFIVYTDQVNPEILLKDIPKETPVLVQPLFISFDFVKKLDTTAQKFQQIQLTVDIFENLSRTGNWFISYEKDYQYITNVFESCQSIEPILKIDANIFHNAGGTIIQQLAYTLGQCAEYLNYFESKQIKFHRKPLLFTVAIGSNYFFEIAKLKALRILWKTLAQAFNVSEKCYIFTASSYRNKTIIDYNVNFLRTTTECMSAALGNADYIYNAPYDSIYNLDNEFGTRLALNQLLIMKNESHFAKVNNATEGSFYIESLTEQIAEKALKLFKDIESTGGYLKQLKEGTIQRKLQEQANQELLNFEKGEKKVVGISESNPPMVDKSQLEKDPFLKKDVRKTLFAPIIRKRLTEKIEKKYF